MAHWHSGAGLFRDRYIEIFPTGLHEINIFSEKRYNGGVVRVKTNTMLKIHKGIVLIAVAIVVTVFVYYRYAAKILQVNKGENESPVTEILPVGLKKVSAVVSYMVTEDKEDSLRFVLTLDKQGVITELATLDAKSGVVPEKKKDFNQQASVMIIGKKLSELSAIDNVAKSTLTTAAFNSAIDELKAQL